MNFSKKEDFVKYEDFTNSKTTECGCANRKPRLLLDEAKNTPGVSDETDFICVPENNSRS